MVRHVDAIYCNGAFRPVEPLAMPEGTRVHLSVQETGADPAAARPATLSTPKLARPQDAADFVMKVRESGDAGV